MVVSHIYIFFFSSFLSYLPKVNQMMVESYFFSKDNYTLLLKIMHSTIPPFRTYIYISERIKRTHRFSVTLKLIFSLIYIYIIYCILYIIYIYIYILYIVYYIYSALLPQHWALHAKVDYAPTFIYIYIYIYIYIFFFLQIIYKSIKTI